MEPLLLPYDRGRTMDGLNILGQEVENASTVSQVSNKEWDAMMGLVQLSKGLYTEEYPLPNNEEIWNAKSTNSKKRSLDIQSLEISDQELTSRSQACVPYWTELTKEWSTKLLSCTKTDLQDSQLTYWSTFSNKKDANSWFTVKVKEMRKLNNLQKISWPSQQSLWHLITENEQRKIREDEMKNAKKKKRKTDRSKAKKIYNLPRTRKIRVYPLKSERDILKKWFGVTRRAYNIGVSLHHKIKQNDKETINKVTQLANEVKRDKLGIPIIKSKEGKIYYLTRGWDDALKLYTRQIERDGKEEWVLEVPQAIRDSGITDFEKAKRSGEARKEEMMLEQVDEDIKEVDFKFRRRKDKSQTFEINARDFNRKNGVIKRLINLLRRKKECLPDKAECAVRVSMDKLGRVFLSFVNEVNTRSDNQAPSVDGSFHSTCALDPGVRTFQAIYDADGQGIEWGKQDMTEIMVLCRHADGIQSKISKKRATWELRMAYHRALRRIKDKIKEVHRKLALFLCENYRCILIPKFEVSRMVNRRNRKLKSKTVRQMATWSHYSFREALKTKSELFPWVKIVEVDEAYTSKTCGHCGVLNQKLGSSKTFNCNHCGNISDRDLHAARNILLRYLTREGIYIPILEELGY